MLKNHPNFFQNLIKNKNNINHSDPSYKDHSLSVEQLSFNFFKKFDDYYLVNFAEFGDFHFPMIKMGNRDTRHLFNLDEMCNFSFYYAMKFKYDYVADFGANIGAHSIILSRSFNKVDAYEPINFHFNVLEEVKKKNSCENLNLFKQAVITSDEKTVDFVHVLGNSTGSHVKNYKDSYGERDFIDVSAVNVKNIIGKYDFVKMDVEGYEMEILSSFGEDVFKHTDFLCEIGSPKAAIDLFKLSRSMNFNIYPQKISWSKALVLADIPTSCLEGNVIISTKKSFGW